MLNTPSLPDDPESLKRLVIEQRAIIDAAHANLLSRDILIERLKIELARLKRVRFGRSSESLDTKIAQLEFTLEELEASETQIAAPITALPTPYAQPIERTKPVRKPLPAHPPREVVTHQSACSCPECGGELKRLGEDVAEVLEYVPSHFKVIRHVRPKLSCPKCQSITQAPAPERPIARGLAGPGLLAHVLVSKYCDHLPLYRQSEIYARAGLELERSTLADWVGQCSVLLTPLINRLSDYVLAAGKLHADDTPVPVLMPGRGTTKQGRLWTYVRDDCPAGSLDPPAVWFAYSPDRKGVHPRTHLKDFKGILQADGYAGFERLYNDADAQHPIKEAACWAHVRRKFYDIHVATQSPLALEALNRIGELYAIEEQVRGQPPPLRQQIRQTHTRPKLVELQAWFTASRAQCQRDPSSPGPSTMRCHAGERSRVTARMAASRSITIPRSVRCARLHWVARITCSPDLMRAVSAALPSTHCSVRPNLMGSIQKAICDTCSPTLPGIRSTVSRNYYRGASPHQRTFRIASPPREQWLQAFLCLATHRGTHRVRRQHQHRSHRADCLRCHCRRRSQDARGSGTTQR